MLGCNVSGIALKQPQKPWIGGVGVNWAWKRGKTFKNENRSLQLKLLELNIS